MKKWIVLIIVAIVAGFTLTGSYNSLVKAEEEIESVWANVESSYQRRADLIPNLVNTVKGQADFEKYFNASDRSASQSDTNEN